MNEEESFVILGSTPTPSMEENFPSLEHRSGSHIDERVQNEVAREISITEMSASKGIKTPNKEENNADLASPNVATDLKQHLTNELSSSTDAKIWNKPSESCKIGKASAESIEIGGRKLSQIFDRTDDGKVEPQMASPTVITSAFEHSRNYSKTNLAADFILGDISSEELKQCSIYTQFPSLSMSNISPEDSLKLQTIMSEYTELKSHLQTTNTKMRRYFATVYQWRNDNVLQKEQQNLEIEKCKEHIKKLQEENKELRAEMENKLANITQNEETMKKERTDLIKIVSEKNSLINNMRVQIEKLEQRNNPSFDFIKLANDKKTETSSSDGKHSSEFINAKQLKEKLSEIAAQNLELQDMKQIYIDEINCLKVNVVSAEELLNKQLVEINTLKHKNEEMSNLFKKYDAEKNTMKEEISHLKEQLVTYVKDFQAEKAAREELVSKNKQLIEDLRMIQKRNQELLNDADNHESFARLSYSSLKDGGRSSPSGPSAPKPERSISEHLHTPASKPEPGRPRENQVYTRSNYECPLCGVSYKELATLQAHVQDCIDKA